MTNTADRIVEPDRNPDRGPNPDAVPSPGTEPIAGNDLRLLSDEARRLADGIAGPLRRLSLRTSGSSVELEWELPARPAAAASSVPALSPAAPSAPPPTGDTTVTSPMVGTFYHAPNPGQPPFVSVGMVVEPDTVVGIVEAMKLMNEITAEHAGVVRDVLVGDRQPVEYLQPLLVLDPLSERAGGQD